MHHPPYRGIATLPRLVNDAFIGLLNYRGDVAKVAPRGGKVSGPGIFENRPGQPSLIGEEFSLVEIDLQLFDLIRRPWLIIKEPSA